jgi:hypothetical protein
MAHGVSNMRYTKINVELIVVADDADAVAAELNAALDGLEEKHTIFGGGIETSAFEQSGTRKKSALKHTLAAGQVAVGALRVAGDKMAGAFRAII